MSGPPRTLAEIEAEIESRVQRRLEEERAAAAAASAAQHALVQAPGVGVSRLPAGLPRLGAPPSFDGRAEQLETWASTMRQQFAYYGLTDAQQVQFAAGCLSGAALVWWESVTSLPAASRPANWLQLDTALRSRFQPVTTSEIAFGQLVAITQGRGTVHA
jgi:hypothetical protein